MRLAVYNICYGTGGKRLPLALYRYLCRTERALDELVRFLEQLDADIIGLLEVDAGSYRFGGRNQAQVLADALGHYHTYRSKYTTDSVLHRLPVFNKQGNAFLTRDTIHNEQFHYFETGIKRLVIELELSNVVIFLVHLALSFRTRHHQLSDLYTLVKSTRKPHIVAGDFNAFWGDREIRLFLAATGLASADPAGTATFPSWAPKRQLDFILCSPEIAVERFWLPEVTLSDHLPLVCDFSIAGG